MIEDCLFEKAKKSLSAKRGLRKPETTDLFKRLLYIGPEDVTIVNYRRKPVSFFNPGAVVVGDKVRVFPRVIFDYYKYVSSIGYFELNIDDLLEGSKPEKIEAKIVLWPKSLWEFLGCEDARASFSEDKYFILYTGKGYYEKAPEVLERKDFLGFAVFDKQLTLLKRGYFSIIHGDEKYLPKSMKDSALLDHRKESVLLVRPDIRGIKVAWKSLADLDELSIHLTSLEPILVNEEWEAKVGWSTNAVKISSNEYLVGWHAVVRSDYSYRNGVALVNSDGELEAVSNYILAPKGLAEEYGDRPLVIFGDGLIKYKEWLIWVGGVSDYAIGFFAAEIDKVLDSLKKTPK
ncbi:MAG: glycosidase [Thermoprotei archaeon]|nr:MAG: glycosidase [Thermoprotei archaeon]